MMKTSRGVAIKAKKEPVKGNMVVFSAAQGGETAYPYNSKRHGMFTFFVLDKLQESGGNTTLGELSDYVIKQVRQNSIRENDKSQTPNVTAAASVGDWRSWTFAKSPAKGYEKRTPSKPKKQSVNKNNGKLIDRPDKVQPTAPMGGTLNYTMPEYTIEGAGTGVQGTYLVKVTMMAKKANTVTDQDLLRCAIHGILFRGFTSTENRQHQRPLTGSALNEQQYADFYNGFFQQSYQQYGQAVSSSRSVMKVGKEYKITSVVSVTKDQLRKDLTQQGVLKGLANGF